MFLNPLYAQLLAVPAKRPFRAVSNRYDVEPEPVELAVRVYDANDMLLFVSMCDPLALQEDVEQIALDLCELYYPRS